MILLSPHPPSKRPFLSLQRSLSNCPGTHKLNIHVHSYLDGSTHIPHASLIIRDTCMGQGFRNFTENPTQTSLYSTPLHTHSHSLFLFCRQCCIFSMFSLCSMLRCHCRCYKNVFSGNESPQNLTSIQTV